MGDHALQGGIDELETLSEAEYHEPLAKLSADTDHRRLYRRLGRLVGVELKRPFATYADLGGPSAVTGAHRSWALVDRVAFEAPQPRATPQRAVLDRLSDDYGDSAYDLADGSRHERGFFSLLAGNMSDRICADADVVRNVDDGHARFARDPSAWAPDDDAAALAALLAQRVPPLWRRPARRWWPRRCSCCTPSGCRPSASGRTSPGRCRPSSAATGHAAGARSVRRRRASPGASLRGCARRDMPA